MSKPKPPTKHDVRSAASQRGLLANRRGKRTEWLAKWWLRLHGYKILCQNFRTPVGEIDLIATRGGVVCFIEVKARGNINAAIYAISANQRSRIERAAEYFLKKHPELSNKDIRFDAFVSGGGISGKLIKDAWRPGW
ncbi:MAG: YraN family protein [Rhodospirillaceae bacterium]|nr:YraN family protein [Rhodospirillaceae bacterium]